MTQRVLATYRVQDVETQLKKRAEGIAIGLTVGSWTDLPATHQARMQDYCGTVEHIEVVERLRDGRVLADMTIGYPTRNFPAAVPALLTTVFGKLSMDGTIKLTHLNLPDAYIAAFPGPKYGVAGIRERTGVADRPLLMSIFKSCIGLTLSELTNQFADQAYGGADFIKDDEIFFHEEMATPEARVVAYTDIARHVYEETGRRVQYAVNLTGPTFALRERARRLADAGAGALLLNVFAYGLDILQELAADPEVRAPIMAHPAVSGALYAAPEHGIAAHILLGQLLRAAGADIAIYPSPYGSVTLSGPEGERLVQALRAPSVHKAPLPAPSAGIHPGLVPVLMRDLGTDFMVNAGGGIHGHPQGIRAGAKAFVDAIAAVGQGQALQEAAADSPELAAALQKWGNQGS